MNPVGQTVSGAVVLAMLAVLVVVKRIATGSVLGERPASGAFLWFTHLFNYLFLLVANPVAGLLLVTRRLDALDPTHVELPAPWLPTGLMAGGLVLFVAGYALMAWALLTLRRGYQVGGNAPRADDTLVVAGPYRLVRHPMYAAALWISLGLACLTQSLAYLGVFATYAALLIVLIPAEEGRLRVAYGPDYEEYREGVGALVPWRCRAPGRDA